MDSGVKWDSGVGSRDSSDVVVEDARYSIDFPILLSSDVTCIG